MITDPLATCAACGTVRVDGRCPGCREAVARAVAAVDAREATDPLVEAIETVLIDGIEAEPGIRLRLGWPKLAAEVLAAVESTGRLLPDGGETKTEWGVQRRAGWVQNFGVIGLDDGGEAEAREHAKAIHCPLVNRRSTGWVEIHVAEARP